jgi:RHS repeat-associated protein
LYGRSTKVAGDKTAAFGFTGHYHHVPTGFVLALYRVYDASLARWITEDPIGFAGGINLYGYVAQNPISFSDPLGLQRKGERRKTGKPEGTPDPIKHRKPIPDKPDKVEYRNPHTGKRYEQPKPPGFDEEWTKRHPPKPPKPKVDPKTGVSGSRGAGALGCLLILQDVLDLAEAIRRYQKCSSDPCSCNSQNCS